MGDEAPGRTDVSSTGKRPCGARKADQAFCKSDLHRGQVAGGSKIEARLKQVDLTDKQERFAQLVAAGSSLIDAYREAYPGSDDRKVGSLYVEASTNASKPKIAIRIQELRARLAERALDEAVVDKAWVLKRLKKVADRCMQASPVLDRKGNPVLVESEGGSVMVPAFTFDQAGANRALELLGREQGIFIDRSESGKPGDFKNESVEDVRKRLSERKARLDNPEGKVVPIRKDAA